MDRQKEIDSLRRLIELAIEHNQSLVKAIERASTKLKAMEATPESKEPETWEDIQHEANDAFGYDVLELTINTPEQRDQIAKFTKRLVIADYCGRRKFVEHEENWTIEILDSKPDANCFKQIRYPEANYFPTKEAAEKYLRICLNDNLL